MQKKNTSRMAQVSGLLEKHMLAAEMEDLTLKHLILTLKHLILKHLTLKHLTLKHLTLKHLTSKHLTICLLLKWNT
ncbi:hypothetical protein DUNSADRAFT_18700 [Dunaliella salina]|uniref:Encoded protein n=1 Tax=Dunaliella salina TaxID=3046 RepID=A0ABQ7FZN7_DUNSA|nr:hypothetical protein DUNSADRAFT_18700 [Dunaliella salina]|eukprot:KAF5827816.1 hypothetical protein DUNSADRAFT_18700 [Dunaliella salina]